MARSALQYCVAVHSMPCSTGGEEGSDALKQAHMEVARLEAQKAEIVSQATAQKGLLAREVRPGLSCR